MSGISHNSGKPHASYMQIKAYTLQVHVCIYIAIYHSEKKIDLHKSTIGLHMMHILCMTICATYAFCSKYIAIVHVK